MLMRTHQRVKVGEGLGFGWLLRLHTHQLRLEGINRRSQVTVSLESLKLGRRRSRGRRHEAGLRNLIVCLSLFCANDIGSTGSRGRTGLPVALPLTICLTSDDGYVDLPDLIG
jgi:hypothetical protein